MDFKQWWPDFFEKTPKAVKSADSFSISNHRHLTYRADRKGMRIEASEFIDGLVKDSFRMLMVNEHITLPITKIYTSRVPIHEKKLADFSRLFHIFLTKTNYFITI